MYFMLLGFDGTDSEAPARRAAARPAHLENIKILKESGNIIYGGALLDEEGNMNGSILILDYPSEEVIRAEFLATEPYATEDVWRTIEIRKHRPADMFR